MSSNIYNPPFLARVWFAATGAGRALTVAECEAIPALRAAVQERHASVAQALECLVAAGNLARRTDAEREHLVYVFTTFCKVPDGYLAPDFIADVDDAEYAGWRTITAWSMPVLEPTPANTAPMPAGRFDMNEYPSRQGNRLTFKDGRVTDLAGNPITGATHAA